jgi:hypothetical protein
VKKQEQPQTNEDGEAHKLVDRIEKKVDDQGRIDPRRRGPSLHSKTATLMKRNLRVVKWLGTIPVVGICTFCGRLFSVPITALKRVSDAQESLRGQFAEHRCKSEDAS